MITLKTLPDASAQDVFNQVAFHLLNQGERAFDGDCVYHAPDGLRCAAGCLISDDEYKDEMEWNSWLDLVDAGLAPIEHANLILDLQNLHDMESPENWADSLSSLADKLDLTVAPDLSKALQAYAEEHDDDA